MTTPTPPQDWQQHGWQQQPWQQQPPTSPPQGQPWPGYSNPQWQPPAPPQRPPAPIQGSVGPRSRGLRAAVLAVGATVAVLAIATGAAGAIARTHVHPLSQVGGEESTAGVTALEVEAGVHDVVVTTHSGSAIEWQTDWRGDPDRVAVVERRGSTLTFAVDDDGWNWRDWGWFTDMGERRTLTIRVPEDLLPGLELDSGAGRVTVDGEFGPTKVRSGVGDTNLTGTVASLRVEAGVGRVEADVATEGPVVIEGGVGTVRVDLGTTTAPESVSIDAGVGTVTVLLPVLREGYSFSSGAQDGIGTVTMDAPPAEPTGLRTDGQVPVSISAGVGTVNVMESTSAH